MQRADTVAKLRDRILFPETGFTLRDAVGYYRRVSRVVLPHLKNVPVAFRRYPGDVEGESFWEKDAPSFAPPWVKTVSVARRGSKSPIRYVVMNDLRTLLWVVESGGIELHTFLHRQPKLDVATSIVFDLDPGAGADLAACCNVAALLREGLAAIGLESLPKVSGSKGMQVHVPLNDGRTTHETTEAFARFVAEELARAHPRLVVANMSKQLRSRRVFIDWSQNAGYKTTIAPYSLRAKRERPLISMPVTWEEVERADPEKLEFTPAAAIRRIGRRGDLFKPLLRQKQTLGGFAVPPATRRRHEDGDEGSLFHGIRLPKYKSQSGRRLFVMTTTEQAGSELWLDVRGNFLRWILRPDRGGGGRLIALPAGRFPVAPDYFRGAVPEEWRDRVTLNDAGAYEVIAGSIESERVELFFTGKLLGGRWILEKLEPGEKHRSWSFHPA